MALPSNSILVRFPTNEEARAHLARFVAPGILGFYTHYEVTEVVGYQDATGSKPINVFSIFVAEERTTPPKAPHFLNPARIRLRSLKGWTFGAYRYFLSLDDLDQAIGSLAESGEWRPSGSPLITGSLKPVLGQFVPPDSTIHVPWNNVLKNNFWNGSHVVEWTDVKKEMLAPLFERPSRLQELSESLLQYVPLRLASLSDRLGNIVVQLPATVVLANFSSKGASGDSRILIAWHEKATPRPLRASDEIEHDHIVTGYAHALAQGGETTLATGTGRGDYTGVLWDDEHGILLASSRAVSYFEKIAVNMRLVDIEPRVFTVLGDDGKANETRIQTHHSTITAVGQSRDQRDGPWATRRMYEHEAARLAADRTLVEYKPMPGRQLSERQRALADIRQLINQHGDDGVWLWDPFLSARDIMDTLFHCSHAGVDLRALTAGSETPADKEITTSSAGPSSAVTTYEDQQRQAFADCLSNFRGLRLEFRVRKGQVGWAFHDRFLIFPNADGAAQAWSLGASVNSLGKLHHILQKVNNGQLIADSFRELWEQLDKPEHLIWKVP